MKCTNNVISELLSSIPSCTSQTSIVNRNNVVCSDHENHFRREILYKFTDFLKADQVLLIQDLLIIFVHASSEFRFAFHCTEQENHWKESEIINKLLLKIAEKYLVLKIILPVMLSDSQCFCNLLHLRIVKCNHGVPKFTEILLNIFRYFNIKPVVK